LATEQRKKIGIDERRRLTASLLARNKTEREIASELGVSPATTHTDIVALKEMSQEFVHDLAKSDLGFFFQQSINSLAEVAIEAWNIYNKPDTEVPVKEKLKALGIIADCSIKRFELLQAGPAVMAMRSLEGRLEQVEGNQVPR